jgi:glycerol-3-phosphate dehydrogenase (NAD+)
MPSLKKIAIVGSGNWGSTIASHIGEKVHELSNEYDQEILMWCKEEILDDGRKLTEVINETHENVKYLPGTKIPDNVIAVSDLGQSVKNADILIFVIPHQFVKQTCEQLKDKIKPNAFALTLIKGFYVDEKTNELLLVSELIKNTLNIPCLSMMGANIAKEVADKIFCEATVGSRDEKHSAIVRQLIDRPYFRLRFYPDVEVIEMLGALKNVIAILVGIADGLKVGFNTRAAIIRLGFREMIGICRLYKVESTPDIYFESCGIADLIASALGGRNYNGAKKMVETNKSLKDIEKEDLNGQSLQGPDTAKQVYHFLQGKNLLDQFPLFRDAHLICEQKIKPKVLLENLPNHPEFSQKQQ